MKYKKLLKKTKKMLSATKREEEVEKKHLRELIEKLEKYEKKKKLKLRSTDDPEARVRLEHRIKVAKAQRKKGKKLLKEMED